MLAAPRYALHVERQRHPSSYTLRWWFAGGLRTTATPMTYAVSGCHRPFCWSRATCRPSRRMARVCFPHAVRAAATVGVALLTHHRHNSARLALYQTPAPPPLRSDNFRQPTRGAARSFSKPPLDLSGNAVLPSCIHEAMATKCKF